MDTNNSSKLSFHTTSMADELCGRGSGYEGKSLVHGVLEQIICGDIDAQNT